MDYEDIGLRNLSGVDENANENIESAEEHEATPSEGDDFEEPDMTGSTNEDR